MAEERGRGVKVRELIDRTGKQYSKPLIIAWRK